MKINWTRNKAWGATRLEIDGRLPGDEIIGAARYRTTHAVGIEVPPDRVWRWVIQLGQGRGGMYSYDWLENLLGLKMHSADWIDPALQLLAVGDEVRLVPEGMEPSLRFLVLQADAPHVLVLGPPTSREVAFAAGMPFPCWTFQIVPTSTTTSRLVVRFQSDFKPTLMGRIAYKYALKPVHYIMERKMLLGIKQRAESASDAPQNPTPSIT